MRKIIVKGKINQSIQGNRILWLKLVRSIRAATVRKRGIVNHQTTAAPFFKASPGTSKTNLEEQESHDGDFAHPSIGMIILAACIPVIGWVYLIYVLFNALAECCCKDDEENSYGYTA